MKKAKMYLLAVAGIATLATSCKKGENDPAISLSSRKARVAGEWTVDSQKESMSTSNVNGSNSYTITNSEEFNGANYTASSVYASGTSSTTTTMTGTVSEYKITFEKDGTFSTSKKYKVTYTDDNSSTGYTNTTTYVNDIVETATGTWNFLGKVEDDFKNKERMILNVTNVKTAVASVETNVQGFTGLPTTTTTTNKTSSDDQTFSNGEQNQVWHLTRLASKELQAEYILDKKGTSSDSETQGNTTNTTTSSFTGTGKGSVSLSQE